MHHYESTFFCDKGCVPKVSVKRTGSYSGYEAYIDVLSDDGIGRQITIFFATIDDLREFVDSLVSETYSIEDGMREEEESTPIYIIEVSAKGGKWQIFDMDGDRSRERAESYIPSNQVAYPDCEFRVVKYQRVDGE